MTTEPTESTSLMENEEASSQISKKQQVLAARGQQVPVDFFLYSCLEQERLNKALGPNGGGIRWPKLAALTDSEQPDSKQHGPGFSEGVKELMSWYSEQYPQLTDGRVLDHEHLAEVVAPFVAMCRDLADFYRLQTGEELPLLTAAAEPTAAWQDIFSSLKQHFPKNQNFYQRFLEWSYATELTEEFIPGSRPPVGRYAPPPLPRAGGRDGKGGKFGSSLGARGGHGGRPERQDPERRGRNPKKDAKPEKETQGRRKAGGDGRSHGHSRRPQGGQVDDARSTHLREKAMAEVAQALATLKSDPGIHEITLLPTNSFYRRMQHQEVVDAGYVSNSTGEGQERAVTITRMKD